ncbi:hypothetical protein MYP_3369 [Sporocytophaga myxococcoides]|uniref:Uncharacterized protein n=1 Tax=Sporocytophaga myxococcoides TaxID=153721 RepID=A0A098LGP3_9BACT|nr:hypothetical protein [Sporocytophaga myxococcoides]GAL86140.1 hypothetical protein MYP_3369 [Sporocytophaga myxococcoides]
MGLDITHYKATLIKPQTTDPTSVLSETRESYNDFNVPFQHFKQYIQEIDCPNILDTVIIAKQENHLDEAKEFLKNYNYTFFLKTNDEELNNLLTKHEIENGLIGLHKHMHDQVLGARWIVLYYYEILKKEGFYYEEVGYQRKGMSSKFWDRFSSEDIYNFALKEDFEYAYSCVDYCWSIDTREIVKQRKEDFKNNFIDNFESGASFLSLSY